ncbi:hypothetical protein AAZX31_16G050800 [Glycine max]
MCCSNCNPKTRNSKGDGRWKCTKRNCFDSFSNGENYIQSLIHKDFSLCTKTTKQFPCIQVFFTQISLDLFQIQLMLSKRYIDIQ